MSKRQKKIKSKGFNPTGISSKEFVPGRISSKPLESFYALHPSWRFNNGDPKYWPFSESVASKLFWSEILDRLKGWETQTWSDILLSAKKENHSISAGSLNKCALDRLLELCIEPDSLFSLRIRGKHRLYGHIDSGAFCILWLDTDHGDNDTCVCRSVKKHT